MNKERCLLVDADGCPVTAAAVRIGRAHGLRCTVYGDTSHEFSVPGAEVVTVSKGPDSADFVLCNACRRGDIVVTQDYGLAAMCLTRGARVLDQDGRKYTQENIDSLLFFRAYSRRVRASGGRLKGPGKRTRQQDTAFETALEKMLMER